MLCDKLTPSLARRLFHLLSVPVGTSRRGSRRRHIPGLCQPCAVPIIRDDGTEDWGLLVRRLGLCVAAVFAVIFVYLVIAWTVVMNTDACWPPWDRLEGTSACVSPM